MKIIAILPLLASSVLAGGPGGPTNIKTAVEGPDKLDQCGCGPIYTKMVECQDAKDKVIDCVCVPNPDGWYGYIHNCRACLSADNESEEGRLFFSGMSSVITQLMVSCTNNGGNVISDGHSICATSYQYAACASLNEGRDSWSSVERNGEVTNGTFFLNIDDGKDHDEHEDIDHGASSTSAPSPSGSSTDGPITSATEGTSPSGTQAASSSISTSTTSSAIRTVASGSRVSGLVALATTFGVGIMLLLVCA